MDKQTPCQECSGRINGFRIEDIPVENDSLPASRPQISSLESRGNLADRGSLFFCRVCGQNFLSYETTPGGSDDAMSTSVRERFDPISKEEVIEIENAWKRRQEKIREEINDYNDDFFDEKFADD